MGPLVSIIIPVYNIENYIDACVQSALEQNYDNFEIILVDDGSTDNSGRKCDDWARHHSRIQVIHKINGGLSSARNAGLDIAKGIYIYFLDGDDTIETTLLSNIVPFMESGEEIVFFQYYSVFPGGEREPRHHELGRYVLNSEEERFEFLTHKILPHRLGWEAWNKIYRRDLIEKYEIRFADNNIIFAEDLYFCLCYCAHISRAVSIDKYLYNYAQRSNSIMSTQIYRLNVGRMIKLSNYLLAFLKKFDDCDLIVSRFYVIYFMILENVYSVARCNLKLAPPELRKMVYADVDDVSTMRNCLKVFLRDPSILYSIYNIPTAAAKISYAKFLYDGCYLSLRIRNRFINKILSKFDFILPDREKYKKKIRSFSKNKRCIYYIGSENYGNIGDNKIAIAISTFAQQYFSEYRFMEVTIGDFPCARPALQKYIKKKDLIFLTGGGNLGDAYPRAENTRQEVVSRWKKNTKIVFPQTIDFSDTAEGHDLLEKAKKIYVPENNVIIFSREAESDRAAKKFFQCESYLVPDIVLTCNEQKNIPRDNAALLCFRDDKEGTLDESAKNAISKALSEMRIQIRTTDLQLPYHVSANQRNSEVAQKLDEIRKASLLITDRLHGMVFAAITGTPCIAFSNYNHKVKGTYEWISYLPYIKYAESVTEAIGWIPTLMGMKECHYDNTPLLPYFSKLVQVVRENA